MVLAVLAVLALLARIVLVGESGENHVHRGELPFNFLHDDVLTRVAPQSDDLVRLVRRQDGAVTQSFAVKPFSLPPNQGDFGGLLPVLADERLRALAQRLGPSFQLVQEGKTRVNELPGYTLVYRWKEGGRSVFGRTVLLPAEEPRATRGVALELTATAASAGGVAREIGLRGAVKKPFRSFRFGTERP